jgi:hypothetical protein
MALRRRNTPSSTFGESPDKLTVGTAPLCWLHLSSAL